MTQGRAFVNRVPCWFLAIVMVAAVAAPVAGQSRPVERERIVAAIDSLVAGGLRSEAVGMTIGVVRGRDTILLKSYGLADLELDVPMPHNAIYQIGSVTKQFTAASILQLQEQGRLSIDDEITKYFPKYPMQGRSVTIRRLLDHTSGIKSYTELPAFGSIMLQSFPRDSLVTLFSAEPFDFEPGAAEVYNNSAFFLLGLIIEKVSGGTYADYVKKNIFDRLGMRDSRYCSESAVVKNRAHGYDRGAGGWKLAQYINHTWPFAAGSLCSTVGDLITWTQALHGGRVIGTASYREMITPGQLSDGTRLRYGKGIAADSLGGHRAIFHGGDIPGFASELEYFPDDSLTIVVLMNSEGSVRPEQIARAVQFAVLGKPVSRAAIPPANAQDYVGVFKGAGRGRELTITIALNDGILTISRNGGQQQPLFHDGGDRFHQAGNRLDFFRDGGRVERLRMDAVFMNTLLKRTP